MLVNSSLSDKLALLCLDVLRALSVVSENSTRQDKDKTNQISRGERDFIRIVVEIIQEIRVPGDEDNGEEQAEVDPDTSMDTPVSRTPKPKSRDVMTEEERTRQDKLDMRCLCLCEGVLERVDGVRILIRLQWLDTDYIFLLAIRRLSTIIRVCMVC
jgi:hypothetical protein